MRVTRQYQLRMRKRKLGKGLFWLKPQAGTPVSLLL